MTIERLPSWNPPEGYRWLVNGERWRDGDIRVHDDGFVVEINPVRIGLAPVMGGYQGQTYWYATKIPMLPPPLSSKIQEIFDKNWERDKEAYYYLARSMGDE